MREGNLIRVAAIAGHEEPTAAALLNSVQAVAGGPLHRLREECSFEAENERAQFGRAAGLFLETRRVDALGSAAKLREVAIREAVDIQQERTAGDAFSPDGADFDAAAIFHNGDDGDHTAFGKVSVLDRLVGLKDRLRRLEHDGLEAPLEVFELLNGQLRKKNIAGRIARLSRFCHWVLYLF